MVRFSERVGAVQLPAVVYLAELPDALKNSIWNRVFNLLRLQDRWPAALRYCAEYFFKRTVDDLPWDNGPCQRKLKEFFFGLEWYEIYDFVEFFTQDLQYIEGGRTTISNPTNLRKTFNGIFERERSGYRFIDSVLSPIANQAEVDAVEEALSAASGGSLVGAHQHLAKALKLLGQRPEPDYRNAIKEAISAVESVAKQLGTDNSQGLSGALEALSAKTELHGALKSAFNKLYGYTSDEGGIRHAMLEESSVGFDEAKYMVVSCSAFVHYLISKASKSGLLI